MNLPRHLEKRADSGKYRFVRRVPSALADLDPRKVVRATLRTSDEGEAMMQANAMNVALDALWGGLLQGSAPEPLWEAHRNALRRISSLGHQLRTIARASAAP